MTRNVNSARRDGDVAMVESPTVGIVSLRLVATVETLQLIR